MTIEKMIHGLIEVGLVEGNIEVDLSLLKQNPPFDTDSQQYLIGSPHFMVVEGHKVSDGGTVKRLSIRDWPY